MSAFESFVSRAKLAPVLSVQHEIELLRRAKSGDARALDSVVQSNFRYVLQIARRVPRRGVPIEDLVSEGNVALAHSIPRFDCDRGFRLITYASRYIFARMNEYVRVRRDGLVGGLGSGTIRYRAFYKVKRHSSQLEALGLSKDEVVHRLSESFGVKVSEVEKVLARHAVAFLSTATVVSTDSSTGKSVTIEDQIADDGPTADERIAQTQDVIRTAVQVHTALQTLTDRERTIVRSRHMEETGRSLSDLGRELGLSSERVRQIEVVALGKMRRFLERSRRSRPTERVVRLAV
jgi:RNA polymerase sigma-32 factor